jgi:hypothetical protein
MSVALVSGRQRPAVKERPIPFSGADGARHPRRHEGADAPPGLGAGGERRVSLADVHETTMQGLRVVDPDLGEAMLRAILCSAQSKATARHWRAFLPSTDPVDAAVPKTRADLTPIHKARGPRVQPEPSPELTR